MFLDFELSLSQRGPHNNTNSCNKASKLSTRLFKMIDAKNLYNIIYLKTLFYKMNCILFYN